MHCIACKHSKYQEDTDVFSEYLNKTFVMPIPQEPKEYVLFSEYACHGCFQRTIDILVNKKTTVFIVSNRTFEKQFKNDIRTSSKCLVDTTDEINKLKFHQGNIGIIKTSNGHIDDIVYLEPNTIDSVINAINIK